MNQSKLAVWDLLITLGKIDRTRERHKEKEKKQFEREVGERQTDKMMKRQTEYFNVLLFLLTGNSNKK